MKSFREAEYRQVSRNGVQVDWRKIPLLEKIILQTPGQAHGHGALAEGSPFGS